MAYHEATQELTTNLLTLEGLGLTLAQIEERLGEEHSISESSIYRILHQEGLAGDGVRVSTRQARRTAKDARTSLRSPMPVIAF